LRPAQPLLAHDLIAAEADAGHDGSAADGQHHADRVAEQRDAHGSAAQRLKVQERPGDVGRHAALAEREQRCRQHGSGEDKAGHRQHGCRTARRSGLVAANHRDRQRHRGGREQLQRRRRERIPAAQQARLGHGEPGRCQHRRQHERVSGQA